MGAYTCRPEDKPLLCNACGARYLVKRSLEGYFPHSRPVRKGPVSRAKPLKGARKQHSAHLGVRNGPVQLKKQGRSSRNVRSSPKA